MPSILNTMFVYRSTKVLESFSGNGMEKQKHFLANLHAMEEVVRAMITRSSSTLVI